MEVNKRILGRQSFELIGRGSEVVASLVLQGSRDFLSEPGIRVKAGSNRGTSLSELIYVLKALLNACMTIFQLMDVARELLTESERRCILGVSSANLDDVIEFGALRIKHLGQSGQFGKKVLVDLKNGGDVHHRWESVV